MGAKRKNMIIWNYRFITLLIWIAAFSLIGLAEGTRVPDFRHAPAPSALSNAVRPSHRRQIDGIEPEKSERTSFFRACYFTNWAQYRPGKGRFTPEDYEPGLCTHILYAFGWMNTDYTIRAYDPADLTNASWQKGMYQRVNDLKQIDPQLKTLLSIGGWTFGTELFKGMTSSARTRKTFIDSSVSFVRLHKFDGLDIDWEYPQGPEDKRNFALLLKELYDAFIEESARTGRPRLLLAAAVSAAENTIDQGYDIPEIAKYVDFVDVMTYDFHGAWESVTGMNSPLSTAIDENDWTQRHWNVEWAVRHWHERGMAPEKIMIGMPTYGRGWTVNKTIPLEPGAQADGASKATEHVQEPGVASYYELCQMLEDGGVRKWDERHQVPYLSYKDQWYSYDDQESYRKKIQWLKENGYGGVFFWTLDFDDFGGYCTSSKGKRYPLIGLARDMLIDAVRPTGLWQFGVASPLSATAPSAPQFSPKSTWQPVTFSLDRPPPLVSDPCQGSPDGFFPYPGAACNHFLLCLHGSGYGMSCPPVLEFSPALGFCVRPPSGCGQLVQHQEIPDGPRILPTITPVATAAAQTQPAPTAVHLQHQHAASARLSSPGPTASALHSAPPPPSALSTEENRHPPGVSSTFICPNDGFHPDPTDCSRFYRCFINIPYEFHCPDGLLYNIETQVCDAPMNVQCTH